MLELTQTILGDKKGNCFSTCIACILEIPNPDMIPNFVESKSRWLEATQKYLAELGLWYLDATLPDGKWEVFGVDTYHVISGMGPRGVRHSVVGRNGKMVWDPHPSREGLLEPDGTDERHIEYGFLVLTKVKARDPKPRDEIVMVEGSSSGGENISLDL